MGLQLSILIGCAGALELFACLKHLIVCVLKLTEPANSCCIEYFHRSRLTDDKLVAFNESANSAAEAVNNKRTCSEIEAILRENRSDPDILCLGPPQQQTVKAATTSDSCVGSDDKVITSAKSSLDQSSGNDRILIEKSTEKLASSGNKQVVSPTDNASLSLAEAEAKSKESSVKSTTKKVIRRSKTPEVRNKRDRENDDDGENEEAKSQKKLLHKTSKSTSAVANKRSAKLKCKSGELGRSAENLTTIRRTKRQRDPERCKSEIQIRDVTARQKQRDEWTNTSPPLGSECSLSRASSKRSISVLIQTSFEDRLHYPENQVFPDPSKFKVCPNCHCGAGTNSCESKRVRRITAGSETDGKAQLIKVSSFEQASEDDYENLKKVIGNGKLKSSIDNESLDEEYVDAEDEASNIFDQAIQYSIPDQADNKSFWVIRRHRLPLPRSPW